MSDWVYEGDIKRDAPGWIYDVCVIPPENAIKSVVFSIFCDRNQGAGAVDSLAS